MKRKDEPEMLEEYDLSGGVRGKYHEHYMQGTNIVVLDADVAKLYPSSKAVNDALRELAAKASG